MPAWRILAFARTRRLAIVGSGTRKARAISAVVSPARVRRVRATRASSGSPGGQARGREGEGGVAEGEDQPQPVVVNTAVVAAARVVQVVGLRRHRDLLHL